VPVTAEAQRTQRYAEMKLSLITRLQRWHNAAQRTQRYAEMKLGHYCPQNILALVEADRKPADKKAVRKFSSYARKL